MAWQDHSLLVQENQWTSNERYGVQSNAARQLCLKCTPIPGQLSIYVGLYVDYFVYYSKSDKVEEWFEQQLKLHVKVDFMGEVDGFSGHWYK